MKTPYCIIDGKKHQLHIVNGVLRFPNDGREVPYDLNQMHIDYYEGALGLNVIFDYYVNSGCSYELVYGKFSCGGINNHTVTQGSEKPKKFKLYLGKSFNPNP